MFGRRVDLVIGRNFSNRYIRESVEANQVELYAA